MLPTPRHSISPPPLDTGTGEVYTVEAWLGRGRTPWRRDNRPRHCLKRSHRNMSDEDAGLAHNSEVTAKRIRITPSTAPASQQQRAFNDVPFPSFYQTSPRKSGSPSQSWSRKSSPIRRLLPQLRQCQPPILIDDQYAVEVPTNVSRIMQELELDLDRNMIPQQLKVHPPVPTPWSPAHKCTVSRGATVGLRGRL